MRASGGVHSVVLTEKIAPDVWHECGTALTLQDDSFISRAQKEATHVENNQVVYLNTLAEGAIVGQPEEIGPDQLQLVARAWKNSQAIVHYRLWGLETVQVQGVKKVFLVGDIGSAKVMLPTDVDFSGLLLTENPERLLNYWISAVIEDYDFADEDNPVLVLNRKKALARLQSLNARRVVPGGEAYGVIQARQRGGYLLNVGGFSVLLPKAFYDWDWGRSGVIGESFPVKIISNEDGRILVSRRDLLQNPFEAASGRIRRGMRVRVKITHMYRGMYKGEIRPGVRISISAPTMFRLLHVGDEVLVQIRGQNKREFYGVVV